MSFEPYIAKGRFAYGTTVDFWITNTVAEDWYGVASQEMTERAWCKQVIKPGARIADCGAHHGMMTVLLAKWAGESGHVTSYELLPENAAVVENNARLNGLNNVTVRPFGIGERDETVEIIVQGSNSLVGSGSGQTARLVRLDDEFAGQHLDFLKLDVEGNELAALRGATKLLERTRPFIDLELHPFLFRDRLAEVTQIMAIIDDRWTLLVSENQGPIEQLDPGNVIPTLAAMNNPHVFCTPRR